MVPISPPEEGTKSDIENGEKESEVTEEVADIARLYEEIPKCSTLSERLKIIFEHWKVFPPRPSTDTYFSYLLRILVAIAALMMR